MVPVVVVPSIASVGNELGFDAAVEVQVEVFAVGLLDVSAQEVSYPRLVKPGDGCGPDRVAIRGRGEGLAFSDASCAAQRGMRSTSSTARAEVQTR